MLVKDFIKLCNVYTQIVISAQRSEILECGRVVQLSKQHLNKVIVCINVANDVIILTVI